MNSGETMCFSRQGRRKLLWTQFASQYRASRGGCPSCGANIDAVRALRSSASHIRKALHLPFPGNIA